MLLCLALLAGELSLFRATRPTRDTHDKTTTWSSYTGVGLYDACGGESWPS